METLPIEVVEIVTQHLTPEDVAHCCGVSQEWRQIFNEDCFWKPHCNSSLEEHLRVTPCVVHPVFENPEVHGSTLTPISLWRMAFLREKHLQNNWKKGNYKEEKVPKLELECYISFLSNNLVARWCINRVEIWDVRAVPAVFMAKTDHLLLPYVPRPSNCLVVGTDLIVVGKMFAKVFQVDELKKCISLKLEIYFNEVDEPTVNPNMEVLHTQWKFNCMNEKIKKCIVKDNKLMHINKSGSTLTVYDLDTGAQLSKESCPVTENQNKTCKFVDLCSSETSDDVVVKTFSNVMGSFLFNGMNPFQRRLFPPDQVMYYFVYSPKHLIWLPFTAKSEDPDGGCAINGTFFALKNLETLTVYNYHNSEVLLRKSGFWCPKLSVFKESFIFKDEDVKSLILFFPSDKHEVTLDPDSDFSYKVFNNRYIALFACEFNCSNVLGVWESAGCWIKQCDIFLKKNWKTNQEFTKAVNFTRNSNFTIFHHW